MMEMVMVMTMMIGENDGDDDVMMDLLVEAFVVLVFWILQSLRPMA